jgi:hypothetical protein
MSERAVVCPHCGTRNKERDPVKDVEPRKVLTNLTREETAALLSAHGADRLALDPPRGVAALFMPHPDAEGVVYAIDVACTLIGLPALFCAAPTLIWRLVSGRSTDRKRLREGSPLYHHLLTAISGGGMLYFMLSVSGVSTTWCWIATLASSIPIALRGMLHGVLR